MGLRELTDEELAKIDENTWTQLLETCAKFQATHFVAAEVIDMCSSRFGERTFLPVGPRNTIKTPEMCEGKHLNDLPSQRQYFTAVVEFDLRKLLDRRERGKRLRNEL